MDEAGRPRCVPEQIVRCLLKPLYHGALEGALHLRQAPACFHPVACEVLVVGDQKIRLGARSFTEGRDGILQEKCDDAVGVDHSV